MLLCCNNQTKFIKLLIRLLKNPVILLEKSKSRACFSYKHFFRCFFFGSCYVTIGPSEIINSAQNALFHLPKKLIKHFLWGSSSPLGKGESTPHTLPLAAFGARPFPSRVRMCGHTHGYNRIFLYRADVICYYHRMQIFLAVTGCDRIMNALCTSMDADISEKFCLNLRWAAEAVERFLQLQVKLPQQMWMDQWHIPQQVLYWWGGEVQGSSPLLQQTTSEL